MKLCSKCNNQNNEKEFNKMSAYKDGLQSRCRECGKLNQRAYYQKNRRILLNYAKDYNKDNSEKRKEYMRGWRKRNVQHLRTYNQQWIEDNKEHVKKRYNKYRRERYSQDIQFKISYNLRTRLRVALKENKKDRQTLYYLSCPVEYLTRYLENLFQPGMSWDNYGEWHIDHKSPLSHFDLTKEEEIRKSCHYTNLQPLWAKDNLKKGSRK